MGDRNCCPCMFCHSDNILPKERPSLTSICHGEKALSLRIESLPGPNHQKKYNHISALSIANSRTAPESSVYLPEIAWNKMWNTWLWIWTFLFLVQIRTVHILHIFHILIVDQPHPGSVNLQSSTSVVNKHKSCMLFQWPPYWKRMERRARMPRLSQHVCYNICLRSTQAQSPFTQNGMLCIAGREQSKCDVCFACEHVHRTCRATSGQAHAR